MTRRDYWPVHIGTPIYAEPDWLARRGTTARIAISLAVMSLEVCNVMGLASWAHSTWALSDAVVLLWSMILSAPIWLFGFLYSTGLILENRRTFVGWAEDVRKPIDP